MGQSQCCGGKIQRPKHLVQKKGQENQQGVQVQKENTQQQQNGQENDQQKLQFQGQVGNQQEKKQVQQQKKEEKENVIESLEKLMSPSGTDLQRKEAQQGNSRDILDNYLEVLKEVQDQRKSQKFNQRNDEENEQLDLEAQSDLSEEEQKQKVKKSKKKKRVSKNEIKRVSQPENKVVVGEGEEKKEIQSVETCTKNYINNSSQSAQRQNEKEQEFSAERAVLDPHEIPILKGDVIEEEKDGFAGDDIIEEEGDIFAQGDAIIENNQRDVNQRSSQSLATKKKKQQNPYFNAKVRSSFKEDEELEKKQAEKLKKSWQELGLGVEQQNQILRKSNEEIEQLPDENEQESQQQEESESCNSEFVEEKILKEKQSASLQIIYNSGILQSANKISENTNSNKDPKRSSAVIQDSKRKSALRNSNGKLQKIQMRQSCQQNPTYNKNENIQIIPKRESCNIQSNQLNQIQIRIPVQ